MLAFIHRHAEQVLVAAVAGGILTALALLLGAAAAGTSR